MRARLALLALVLAACASDDDAESEPAAMTTPPADPWTAQRTRMVETQIQKRGVDDPRVLAAMRAVPRHEFVPEPRRHHAYEDNPLPIGEGQTISQPYIVAFMAQLAELPEGARVLEIGTGSGYGAAVLAKVAKEVYTIEILEPLARRSEAVLERLGYDNVTVRHGDGYRGWPEKAPFDAIVVTAAPPRVPEPLKEQLKVGGRLVLPVGTKYQRMLVITRTDTGYEEEFETRVKFVPMTGEIQTEGDGAD